MSSTLLCPVPVAEETLRGWWPLWSPPRARGIEAHVSVCFPFLRRRDLDGAVRHELREVAAAVPPFTARFDRVGRFPSTVYLEPDPAGPFVALMRGVRERFPRRLERPGHGLVPHLTVLTCADEALLDEAASAAAALPPIVAPVDELWLVVERDHGPWEVEERFPLGDAAVRARTG